MSRRVGKQHLKLVPAEQPGAKPLLRIQSSLWFGWDGDRMVTMQNDRQASTTIYEPDSFVPMLRVDRQLQADERRAQGETRTYHVHCNHLGTPEALIAQDGLELVWQIELDPWGQTQREYNPNNMLQPIRMQGQQLDQETGLFYNRYRYYDPAGGRYITQDPLGLAGGVNLYGYVVDPNGWIDPMGLAGKIPINFGKGKPINPIPKPGSESKKDIFQSIQDTYDEIMKSIKGEDQKSRIDEVMVCAKQRNVETGKETEPPDVMAPDSRGRGVTRPPSPSEIASPFKCIDERIRQLKNAGPLPGFEVPGRIY
jgi:RHS repeat-associated protein